MATSGFGHMPLTRLRTGRRPGAMRVRSASGRGSKTHGSVSDTVTKV